MGSGSIEELGLISERSMRASFFFGLNLIQISLTGKEEELLEWPTSLRARGFLDICKRSWGSLPFDFEVGKQDVDTLLAIEDLIKEGFVNISTVNRNFNNKGK